MAKIVPFTDNEIKLICENYMKMSNKELSILLNNEENNNRTDASIKSKINSLGLKRGDKKNWTPEELDILKKYYKIKTNKEIQQELIKLTGYERSIQTIGVKAKSLGLTEIKSGCYWDAEEKEIINSVLNKSKDKLEHPQEDTHENEESRKQEPQDNQDNQEEKFNPKAEGKRYEYIRKYIQDKDINLLIKNSIAFFGISDLFICNSVDMSYKDFNKKYYNDSWSIQDKINISNFLQDYFIGSCKIDIEKLYS